MRQCHGNVFESSCLLLFLQRSDLGRPKTRLLVFHGMREHPIDVDTCWNKDTQGSCPTMANNNIINPSGCRIHLDHCRSGGKHDSSTIKRQACQATPCSTWSSRTDSRVLAQSFDAKNRMDTLNATVIKANCAHYDALDVAVFVDAFKCKRLK